MTALEALASINSKRAAAKPVSIEKQLAIDAEVAKFHLESDLLLRKPSKRNERFQNLLLKSLFGV